MAYILPQDVTAPKEHSKLHRVIVAGAEGTPAYALGTWTWHGEETRCIGTRWNGDGDNPVGWPRIYAFRCWHILDAEQSCRRQAEIVLELRARITGARRG
jgi:hypothetical protein